MKPSRGCLLLAPYWRLRTPCFLLSSKFLKGLWGASARVCIDTSDITHITHACTHNLCSYRIAAHMKRSRSWVHSALARRTLQRTSYACDGGSANKLDALPSRFHQRSLHHARYSMVSYSPSPLSTIYQWQEDIENLEKYSPGGYHPVCIDDEFCQRRYKVVHKLGFGNSSTIWLAKDNKQSKYVAVKFAVSATTKLSKEMSILEHLNCARQDSTSAGKHQIPTLLDHFIIEGPNGQHQCFISEPSRCSLSLSKLGSMTGLFPLEAARAIAAQLILGVNYIHSRGVAHGGRP